MKYFKKCVCALLMLLVLSCGSTTILSYTAPITAEAATIKINKQKITLSKGNSYQLKIKGTTKKVTWKSDNPSVAKVSSKGLVTAKKAGTAKITAKISGKKYICTVTVTGKTTKSGKELLKEYIIKHGDTNYDGNKFITYEDNDQNMLFKGGIVYENNNFLFMLICTSEDVDGTVITEMSIPVNKDEKFTAVNFLYSEGAIEYHSTARINIATYTTDMDIDFKVTKARNVSEEDVFYLHKMSDYSLKVATLEWEIMLKNIGLNMKDIGFLRPLS